MFMSHFPRPLMRYIPIVGDISDKHPAAYWLTRVFVSTANVAQIAFSKAYIRGFELPDRVVVLIVKIFFKVAYKFPALLVPYDWVLREARLMAEGSSDLMKKHYDLPLGLMVPMLGEGKLVYPKYTMALWEKGATSLEAAQIDMMDDVIEKMGIKDGDSILDFGCGFGSAANYFLSRFPNITVTGVNLSSEQCEYIREKMKDEDSFLSKGRFRLVEGNINEVHLDEKFDKILSFGVFCHISNPTDTFRKLASFLKPKGKCFTHIFTTQLPHNISTAFTHEFIFPHGRFWHHGALPKCNRDLRTVRSWYINGNNYAQTLAAWFANFEANQETIKDLEYWMGFRKFRRMWRLYLMFFMTLTAMFDGEFIGNGQYLMVHADEEDEPSPE